MACAKQERWRILLSLLLWQPCQSEMAITLDLTGTGSANCTIGSELEWPWPHCENERADPRPRASQLSRCKTRAASHGSAIDRVRA